MVCVWNGDNGAILIGRWLGRRRLFKVGAEGPRPRRGVMFLLCRALFTSALGCRPQAVSPNKTWAGVLAQFATASLTSVGVGVAARAYGLGEGTWGSVWWQGSA